MSTSWFYTNYIGSFCHYLIAISALSMLANTYCYPTKLLEVYKNPVNWHNNLIVNYLYI